MLSWDEYSRWRRDHGKIFRDPLYNYITLTPLAAAALDTPPLQRLRHLKQLGCASAVYPCAEHSRFVHSLGVAHLGVEMGQRLRDVQPDLELSPLDVQIVELAGLCHDIGHGPFSHVFEAEFLKKLGIEWSHEAMSAKLIDAVVDSAALDLDCEAVRRVKDLVCAGKVDPLCNWTGREFMLQIVANAFNGVDVDKFDYLRRDAYVTGCGGYDFAGPLINAARVVDASEGFKSGMEPKLHGLFTARAEMHQQVYTHRKVKCVEYLVVDAMRAANGPLRISDRIHSAEDFVGLTDSILLEARNSTDPALAEAAELVRRIERRDVYSFCAEIEVPQERALHWQAMTEEEVVGRQDHSSGVMLTPADVRVHNLKIDFMSGGSHPARRVPIWHRDGTVELCSELPFSPALCLQRKVRVYLAKATSDATERAATIRAVQSAFASAVRARLGSNARIILGGERAPMTAAALAGGAASRSGLSGGHGFGSGVFGSGGGGGVFAGANGGSRAAQQCTATSAAAVTAQQGGGGASPSPDAVPGLAGVAVAAGGPQGGDAAEGIGIGGRGREPGSRGVNFASAVAAAAVAPAATPEKQPPPKRRLGSAEEEEGPAGRAAAAAAAAAVAVAGAPAGPVAAGQQEEEGEVEEELQLCTQESASASAATKRRRPAG